ncbi:hypothetical protein RGQ13_11075 [Thalassotalea psychrophila]|uniref:Polysaccharide chain length determinant N-terminal domain-containing protein n=1 Tax=Thalassotalea psychrophila TaxID=3065647 RepID=A0ABY9TQH6_9GAMM|nr:hypothetical protein RGQ13_11075 [Colwelliaceae bacterium SQ149]
MMIISPRDKIRGYIYRLFKKPYLIAGLLGYLSVLAMVFIYLNMPEKYSSEVDLVLPGTGTSSNVKLNEVGEVISQTSTPYGSSSFNPRVNYKEMLTSRSVLERAALIMGISIREFAIPVIKLTEQTSIISIKVNGRTAKEANGKANALYTSLQQELDRLRADEVLRRDASIKVVLTQYQNKLNHARGNIVDFQQNSMVVASIQLEQMVTALSDLNEKHMLVSSELKQLESYIRKLSQNLGVSPSLAGQVFKLQTDAQFSSYLTELDTSIGELTTYSSRWGNNHPKVISAQQRVNQVNSHLKQRSMQMIGIHVSESFNSLDLKKQNNRAQLFADLIDSSAIKEGKQAMLANIEQSIIFVRDKLKIYSREVSELERLEHDFHMAEAIYTSAAARIEASKADIFASYPVIQQLTVASFPQEISSPKMTIALAAGFIGFIFITLFLVAIWQRRNLTNLLLNKS